MDGTFNGEHIVYLTITNLECEAIFNELQNATIDTVTPDGSLDITGANTGEDITIGDMEGTFNGEHVVNLNMKNLVDGTTVKEVERASINTDNTDGSLDITGGNTGDDHTIGANTG